MAEKTLTLPTMAEMTSMYLFGQLEKPNNLLDENLIRPKDLVVDYPVKININEYMTDGAGRFVSAKDFKFLDEFFTKSSNASENLEAGRYTKSEILQALKIKFAGVTQSTAEYDDGKDNLLERAYIWNSVAFMVNDDAIFVVDEDGNRSIENFAIVPYSNNEPGLRDENGKPMENFDFEGGTTSQIANSMIEWKIDPSGIGRTVNIKFDWDNVNTKTLSYQDYQNEKTSSNFLTNKWNQASVGWDSALTNNLVQKLWDNGIIRFLDEDGRIIFYGTHNDDKYSFIPYDYENSSSEFDSMNNTYIHIELPKLYAKLGASELKSGVVFISGDGDDSVMGSVNNDKIIGNSGSDTLNGNNGDDVLIAGSNKEDASDTSINTLIGGKGSDEIHGAAGADILVGGYYGKNGLFGGGDVVVKDDGESDRMEGGDGSDTYYAGDTDVIKDKDGQGEVYFILDDGDKTPVRGKAYRDTSVSDQQVYLQGENIKYTLNGKNLTVELIKEGKTLTIEEFNKENCDLNIQLIEKAGKDIVFVIDVTGSMSGDINTVKANVKNMISKLFTNTNDENLDTNIGIMTYTDGSLSWIAKNADTPQKAYSAINAVFEKGGGTELVATSLSKALNEFDWRAGEEYAKQIWLFGDEPGDDLDGLSKVYALSHNKKVELDGEKEGAFEYIPINTIALSSGSTASVFQSIAENTKGMYFYGRADLDTALNDIANLGTSADETINGTDANNTINGKGGDDTLSGGLGSDTYVETGDFGHDTIIESNPDGKDKNKVDFADTSVQDYGFENDNGNLVITNGDNSVTVNDFYGDENKVDQFVFNDAVIDNALAAFYGNNQSGKNVNYTETAENVQTGIFGGRQFVVASDDAEVNTSWFQDAVVVNGNNVSVDTGLNNDQVYVQGSGSVKTGGGSDKIFIGSEFGSVNVYDSSGVSDEINFTAHNLKDLYVSQDGKNFSFGLLGSPESVITVEAQNSLLHRIENFSFSDGTNISYKDLGALAKIYENHSYEQIATDANIAKSIEEQLSFQGFLA